MSYYRFYVARKVPRYRRRKFARFMHGLSSSPEMAAGIFCLGVLAGIGVSKLLGMI